MGPVLVKSESRKSLRGEQSPETVHLDLELPETLALLQILGACLESKDLASGPRARIQDLFVHLLHTLPPRFRERLLVTGYLR